ncbi:MAG: hypothetical protein PHN69_02540 [Candidatus Pacebacteria bacterium]|nr:hypothetical protein [Candidatus Paceibacterota bacterium]
MSKPRLPKVEENGKEYNMCPICGGPCTTALWRTVRRCMECNILIKKGHSIDETKAIRLKQRHNNYKDKIAIQSKPIPIKKEREANFRNIIPKGITVKGNNAKEGQILTDTYNIYHKLYGHLAEFTSMINPLLFSTLESYKIIEKTRINSAEEEEAKDSIDKKTLKNGNKFTLLTTDDKKTLFDIQAKQEDQIRKILKQLDEIKLNRVSASGNIFITEFQKSLRFHHEQGQYYHAVGVCTNCNHRIILQTEFPTFLTRYNSALEDMIEELKEKNYDSNTLDEVLNMIKQKLDNDAFVDTYVSYHVRKMEEALL